ncbi:hypothetical protein EZ456_24390 [Pedobacter psychrodurus]|uniref:Uncharacterized protein n=1 Tax=Pedobacter psychrodurus TaxID=2530456 RepID=A0A4R0PGQ4_9SPHI|nr:hypothetical protein [Pedobacter psychrodurus]TCD15644.1 hypothetical protein EZ456_24390 [Pedobacter psychrodurus]
MKIFNQQPITINEYIYNDQYLKESKTSYDYQSGFEITGEKIGEINTMFITFDILYCVDAITDDKEIVSPTGPNSWDINVSFSIGDEVFISYKSSCQFNFESEGLAADVASLTNFLTDYQAHTKQFFSQYGYKPLIPIEEGMRKQQPLIADAELAIENLRANNMYEF